jgi:hypothetical protein
MMYRGIWKTEMGETRNTYIFDGNSHKKTI